MLPRLAFGIIAAVYGVADGYNGRQQYFILLEAITLAALIRTFSAQCWFVPKA